MIESARMSVEYLEALVSGLDHHRDNEMALVDLTQPTVT
jgi:hypothetical protein